MKLWLKIDELRDRLVVGGVHPSLSSSILLTCLKRFNKINIMSKRLDHHTSYYRPSTYQFENGTPSDQQRSQLTGHNKWCLPILPTKNYFISHPDTSANIPIINSAIIQYASDMKSHDKEVEKLKRRAKEDLIQKKTAEEDDLIQNQEDSRVDVPSIEGSGMFDIVQNREDSSLFVPNIEGSGIFDIPTVVTFIQEAISHAAQCHSSLDLTKVDKRFGTGIIMHWNCPTYKNKFELYNCRWKRSVKQRGRKFARIQPDINVKIAMGARVNGINFDKMIGLISGSFGIKMMNKRNLRNTELKIQGVIGELFGQRREENMALHVTMSKEQPEYEAMEWEWLGEKHTANDGTTSTDGGGKKRSYKHHIDGDETATTVQSPVARVPISLVHSQVSIMALFFMTQLLLISH